MIACFNEFDKTINGSLPIVILYLVHILHKYFNIDTLNFVLRRIYFSNDNILRILILVCQLIPGRVQLLAMSTPWSIKHDHRFLIRIIYYLMEILIIQNFYGLKVS